jgi:hypothetical protein
MTGFCIINNEWYSCNSDSSLAAPLTLTNTPLDPAILQFLRSIGGNALVAQGIQSLAATQAIMKKYGVVLPFA